MPENTDASQLGTLLLVILGTIIVLPVIGMVVPLVFLLVVLGGGYFILQRPSEERAAQDPAMEELRAAYARGDLSEEEFEERRRRLQTTRET